ncbi:discoidin domain-containing protein [Lacimicrobium sp. SS2-24]|uniref:discoidin domain-containing protein n=1 Tax=Lacimicrobium sp. SS2-24 TaxID=2005569 RepID=UPI000B4B5962|nr:discoidin domain-containing protein [Lacimicrobium sp. SS2-24]
MKKKAIPLALLMPLVGTNAQESMQEYAGNVTDLMITKSGSVLVGVKQTDDNNLLCEESDWPLAFDAGSGVGQHWLDFLMLARNTNQKIRIGYMPAESTRCDVEYVAATAADGYGDGSDPIGGEGDNLIETGVYGNVALIDSNGLSAASFSASGHYRDDVPAAAFDGYTWDNKVNEDAGQKINRGLWLFRIEEDTEAWIQVDFGHKVSISGMRLTLNEKASQLGRGPRDVVVQASNDGNNFVDHESFRLANIADQTGSFNSAIEARYIRLQILNNFGDANYIEIDELELYQKQN